MPDDDLSTCRSCGAAVQWVMTSPQQEPGKPPKRASRIPLDVAPVNPRANTGALALVEDDREGFLAVGRNKLARQIADAANSQGGNITVQEAKDRAFKAFRWYDAHFSSCPNAELHRKPRRP